MAPDDILVLVGPNNAGKSKALREILNTISTGKRHQNVVIKDVVMEKIGSKADFLAFLTEHAELRENQYRLLDWSFSEGAVGLWDQQFLSHGLSPGFIKLIDASNRLNICSLKDNVGRFEPKECPQHVLYDDELLMNRISLLFRQAFGKDLFFDFRGGTKLPVHVGEDPKGKFVDRVSNEYVDEVRKNPLLHEQGDGMKGFAGILFSAIVSKVNITLLDEPEAFLHPPQMRRLGATLAKEMDEQLLVATHSSDILRGFLEGKKGKIRVARITRESGVNRVFEAPSDAIAELWEKPALRYSNALDAIFHDVAILCEDESDCRLINAVEDCLNSADDTHVTDVAYVPCGGKHSIPKIAAVLRKVGVPIKAVFDIDILSESSLLRETVESFGGVWQEIEPTWRRLDLEVRKGCKPLTPKEIRQRIADVLEDSGPEVIPKSAIQDALKSDKEWSMVKQLGSVAIPRGDAQEQFRILMKSLESIGVYVIEVGEVEGFYRQLGSHGPKFVTRLLSEVPLDDPNLATLRDFVSHVLSGMPSTPVS